MSVGPGNDKAWSELRSIKVPETITIDGKKYPIGSIVSEGEKLSSELIRGLIACALKFKCDFFRSNHFGVDLELVFKPVKQEFLYLPETPSEQIEYLEIHLKHLKEKLNNGMDQR